LNETAEEGGEGESTKVSPRASDPIDMPMTILTTVVLKRVRENDREFVVVSFVFLLNT